MTEPRAITEHRVPAVHLHAGDLVNTSPGGDDDWQEVLGVYASTGQLASAPPEVRELVRTLGGRYVVVQLTDIAPVDFAVYFADGQAMAASDDGDDQPVTDLVSTEDGVRTYLYTKYEVVTARLVWA
ncbi:MAG: hypothetical protein FWD74_07980 [Actinomycetia bacterium]|nr:hypothetical protein [Actinomycetes bacterium]